MVQSLGSQRQAEMSLEDAKERARSFLLKRYTPEQLKQFAEMEDAAACKMCGRHIFCGATLACNNPNCELQQRKHNV